MDLPTLIIIGAGLIVLVSWLKDDMLPDLQNLFKKPQVISDAEDKKDEITEKLTSPVQIPLWMLIVGGIMLMLIKK